MKFVSAAVPKKGTDPHPVDWIDTFEERSVLDADVLTAMSLFETEKSDMGLDEYGVSGNTTMHRKPAVLAFQDSENERLYRYRAEVRIGSRTGSSSNLPSLLGQDILQNWSLLHEPDTGRLEATPLTR